MTREEEVRFWELVRNYMVGGQRKGQAFMNALQDVNPELYEMVTVEHPEADCYYDDSKAGMFRLTLNI